MDHKFWERHTHIECIMIGAVNELKQILAFRALDYRFLGKIVNWQGNKEISLKLFEQGMVVFHAHGF